MKIAGARNRLAISLRSPQAAASCFGIAVLVVLAVLVGRLGLQAREYHPAAAQRQEFMAAGRQGAVNLTSIDWQHVDDDVQRILNNATGTFHDDFASRSKPFIDVVKRAQSASVGSVTEVGLESATDQNAQVLVAVSVNTAWPVLRSKTPAHGECGSTSSGRDQVKVANVNSFRDRN